MAFILFSLREERPEIAHKSGVAKDTNRGFLWLAYASIATEALFLILEVSKWMA